MCTSNMAKPATCHSYAAISFFGLSLHLITQFWQAEAMEPEPAEPAPKRARGPSPGPDFLPVAAGSADFLMIQSWVLPAPEQRFKSTYSRGFFSQGGPVDAYC